MPFYKYLCDKCKLGQERFFTMADYQSQIPCLCGSNADRVFGFDTVATPGNYPMESTALGVNPSQRKEAYDHSVQIGVPTEFNEKGNPVWKSRSHRKKYCEKIEFFDRDGGYGDPQPK